MVSLPALELARCTIPAAFFGLDGLETAPFSAELRRALTIVASAAARRNVPVCVVARPEMFTHGETLSWLREMTKGAEDHLCITDGSALRLLPGFRTHAFFYRSGTRDGDAALRQLALRAPELAGSLATQVNTAVTFRLGSDSGKVVFRPPTEILPADLTDSTEAAAFLPFFLGPNGTEDSVQRITGRPPWPAEAFEKVQMLNYIAVTGRGWEQPEIAAELAKRIANACLDPRHGVIIRAPQPAPATPAREALNTQLRGLLDAMRRSSVMIPAIMPRNIAIVTQDLTRAQLGSLPVRANMLVDAAFEAWHYDHAFYEHLDEVFLLLEQHPPVQSKPAQSLMAALMGRAPIPRPLQNGPDKWFPAG